MKRRVQSWPGARQENRCSLCLVFRIGHIVFSMDRTPDVNPSVAVGKKSGQAQAVVSFLSRYAGIILGLAGIKTKKMLCPPNARGQAHLLWSYPQAWSFPLLVEGKRRRADHHFLWLVHFFFPSNQQGNLMFILPMPDFFWGITFLVPMAWTNGK